jgi:hypothetical protein
MTLWIKWTPTNTELWEWYISVKYALVSLGSEEYTVTNV